MDKTDGLPALRLRTNVRASVSNRSCMVVDEWKTPLEASYESYKRWPCSTCRVASGIVRPYMSLGALPRGARRAEGPHAAKGREVDMRLPRSIERGCLAAAGTTAVLALGSTVAMGDTLPVATPPLPVTTPSVPVQPCLANQTVTPSNPLPCPSTNSPAPSGQPTGSGQNGSNGSGSSGVGVSGSAGAQGGNGSTGVGLTTNSTTSGHSVVKGTTHKSHRAKHKSHAVSHKGKTKTRHKSSRVHHSTKKHH
jgi:hypothetical protein